MAVGSTTFTMVQPLRHAEGVGGLAQLVRARGWSISSVERTTTGIISTDERDRAARCPIAGAGAEEDARTARSANRPATIDGMPVMTSTRNVIAAGRAVRWPYSTR